MQTLLMTKPDTADFKIIAAILGVSEAELGSEWRILRRLPEDLHNQESLIRLATSPERAAMFPAFSSAVKKLLLLPIGSASVERSFSTIYRIVSSKRSRLLPDHTCQLMQHCSWQLNASKFQMFGTQQTRKKTISINLLIKHIHILDFSPTTWTAVARPRL